MNDLDKNDDIIMKFYPSSRNVIHKYVLQEILSAIYKESLVNYIQVSKLPKTMTAKYAKVVQMRSKKLK